MYWWLLTWFELIFFFNSTTAMVLFQIILRDMGSVELVDAE